MKKFLAISLATIYLAISSGIVINFHYCMGKIQEVTLGKQQGNKCGKCGMENTGCCNDEVKVVKLQDSHQLVQAQAEISALPAIHITHTPNYVWQSIASTSVSNLNNHSPPGDGEPSICIKNCVFRI